MKYYDESEQYTGFDANIKLPNGAGYVTDDDLKLEYRISTKCKIRISRIVFSVRSIQHVPGDSDKDEVMIFELHVKDSVINNAEDRTWSGERTFKVEPECMPTYNGKLFGFSYYLLIEVYSRQIPDCWIAHFYGPEIYMFGSTRSLIRNKLREMYFRFKKTKP